MVTRTTRERVVHTRDAESTRALGVALGRVAQAGDVIALTGDLGAGKTQLAKGIGAGLDVTGTVNSPSFILMAEHRGRLPLFHLDLYRIGDPADAVNGGLIDERQAEGVTVVEWAERLGPALPVRRLDVTIDGSGDEPRTIRLRATDDSHARLVEAAR